MANRGRPKGIKNGNTFYKAMVILRRRLVKQLQTHEKWKKQILSDLTLVDTQLQKFK